MGRTTTPTYRVEIFVFGYHYSPMAWSVRARGKIPGFGQPTDANLAKYVSDFEEDCETGANKHLGTQIVRSAKIVKQSTDEIVATYALAVVH